MSEAQKIPVVPANRCLGIHCQRSTEKQSKDKVKKILVAASQRKMANRAIRTHINERRCRLSALLPMMETWVATKRLSLYVFEVLIERVEGQRRRNELSLDEIMDLERAKSSPVRQSKK